MSILVESGAGTGRKPATGVPLHFEFTAGAGELSESVQTDSEGVARSHVTRITSTDKLQTIRASIDVVDLARVDRTNAFFSTVVGKLAPPAVVVPLQVFPQKDKEQFYFAREFDGKTAIVHAAHKVGDKAALWGKMSDTTAASLRKAGAKVSRKANAKAEAIVGAASDDVSGWDLPGMDAAQITIVAVAAGEVRRRDNGNSPVGEDCAFNGKIMFHVAEGGELVFSDDFKAMGGWNPMGEEMCLDVLALQVVKRWRAKHVRQVERNDQD